MMKLTAEDVAMLGMLSGATFGPDSVLKLPSGTRVIGPEITNLINWVAKLPMDYDERRIGVEQQPMSEWKPIDKDGAMAMAPKGTNPPKDVEPYWNKLAFSPLTRAEVACHLATRREDHSPHNWSRAGIPVRCPGFVEDVVREGDQPLPTPNDRPDIQSLVLEDIRERRNVGIQRYGTPLQPHNGRDALRDAYEEALDLVMYLRQMIEERNS